MRKEVDESGTNADLPFFSLSTIVGSTDNFSLANKLGEGGFGSVYKVPSPSNMGQVPQNHVAHL